MNAENSLTPFSFHGRTRIEFGPGSIAGLGSLIPGGCRRVLVVTDPGVAKAGHAAHALDSIERAGLEARCFDGVVENPTDACVARGVEAARAAGAEAVAAVGGGSAMDCAKSVALLITNGGEIADYRGHGKVKRPILPLFVVPTTAGTGSEVQSAALITASKTGEKMLIKDPHVAPLAAVLDPELTLTLPPTVTAATGIDAITHAVESFVSTKANALSRAFAAAAFRHLRAAFPKVLDRPDDLGARGAMLVGASLAGLSIESSMLGAAHSAANPLTHCYGITHGVAVGLLLPHVVRFNAEEPRAAAAYGELTGRPARDAARGLASDIEVLLDRARLPARLAALGIARELLSELADEAAGQWTAGFNPRPVRAHDFLEIYQCAF